MTKNKAKITILTILFIAVIISLYWIFFLRKDGDSTQNNRQPTPQKTEEPKQETTTPSFDKTLYSIDDPTSLWVIVNKKRPLPASYIPSDLTNSNGSLRTEAAAATQELIQSARQDQVNLKVISGYRSYSTQTSTYNSYVQTDGRTKADTYSARPGHSEHQTGLVADLGNSNGSCDLDECFANTVGGKWLAAHAHEYGFTIRYMQGKTSITGYQYEPWHIRYVGKELATELKSKNLTMEEFFGLPAANSY